MKQKLKLLLIDDSEDDVILILNHISKSYPDIEHKEIKSSGEMKTLLNQESFDLILSDFHMPGFSGLDALKLLQESGLDIPFIIISGLIGEDIAVQCMIDGANDYIMKDNLSRLIPAIDRELKGAAKRAELRRLEEEQKTTEEELRKSEYRKTIINSIASVFLTEPDEEMYAKILNILLKLTNSQFGLFGFIDENGDLNIPSLTHDIWNKCQVPAKTRIFPPSAWGRSLWGLSITDKKINLRNNGEFHVPEGHIPISNFISVPIVFNNETIGLISFANKDGGYSEEERLILGDIAVFISPILNARLQRDHLERVRKEAELELIAAKEKAEESDRLKSAFLKNMSHEVRTPLNAIYGFTELIDETELTAEEIKEYTRVISESSKKILRIITDVIDISRLGSNQVEVSNSEFDILAALTRIAADYSTAARKKDLIFNFSHGTGNREFMVFSDEDKIKKIVSHLIDNAIKFTSSGSIDLNLDVNNDSLVIVIRDTGVGVSDEMQEIIFEPFRQIDPDPSRVIEGNGLGLPIARAYLDLLGGNLKFVSVPDKGTAVTITIPISTVQ